ncbi:Mannose-1-phosphate guanylyltransferase / Mannose-6-phosphate isomerase [hydrothermal vent metagenome]|uniref:mannose-1-phosphate guanylyltransferase n=1 Tax=hydrothermal vent metagenome TaxID=652676 RepID=A0A3B1A6M7_9ZZZZ
MSQQIQPVILSGGSGSRLWPLSRAMYPKQLLALVTDNTMLQETALRLKDLGIESNNIKINAPIIVCNEDHRFFVAEQMRQLGIQDSKIILEPTGRNTAPALTLAALATQEKSADAIMLVMPADHVIDDIDVFHQVVKQGAALAADNYLVTFGIQPNAPETGYGYIKTGTQVAGYDSACLIERFVEKPDATTAEKYLSSGDYLWNSGLFMMTAASWLDEIKLQNKGIFVASEKAYKNAALDNDFCRVDKVAFEASPSDSIDYAVMEKAAGSDSKHKAAVIPLNAGWSDVGVWSTLWEVGEKDARGNVTKGDVALHDTENSLLYSSERYIAAVGLKDTVVVETADAILVANKNCAQDVKKVVEALKKQNRDEYQNHRLVYRPWGSYECIDKGERYQAKRITVNPGAALSLQLHHHRAEHWIVVKGTAEVTRGDEVFLVTENESTYIPLGTKHRLENKGAIPLEMIEVQSGSYLGEDDIVRFEDIYGRSGSSK